MGDVVDLLLEYEQKVTELERELAEAQAIIDQNHELLFGGGEYEL